MKNRERPWVSKKPPTETATTPTNDNLPTKRVKTSTKAGKRVRLTTTTRKDGTTTTKLAAAPDLEWRLQAAAVRRLRPLTKIHRFAFAGDMNGLPLFGAQQKTKAKATGMTPGEHDLRIYLDGGQLGLIELKNTDNTTSGEQRKRHALLADLGFTRQAIVRVATEAEAADQVEAIVLRWVEDVKAGGKKLPDTG